MYGGLVKANIILMWPDDSNEHCGAHVCACTQRRYIIVSQWFRVACLKHNARTHVLKQHTPAQD